MQLPAAILTRGRLATSLLPIALMVTVGYLSSTGQSATDGGFDRMLGSAAALHGEPSDSDSAPVAATTVVASNQAAIAVFNDINAARRKAGLPTLRWTTGLYRSALVHNYTMARVNVLSHQLAHEPAFGNRITAQRVAWTTAGENIGWTSVKTVAGAVSVNAAMLAEKAPNDGHRRNILSTSFTGVGVNVVLDTAHGRLWITEDFVRG